MSQATNIDVPLKTLVTKPKAKGRFGSSQATRSHQPRDLVFDRVEDTLTGTGQSSKPESRNIAPARGMKQKYAQSRPYYKDNRRLKTDSTEGNWRHREDKSVNTSGQADTTLLSGCNRKGGGKSQVEKGYNGKKDESGSTTSSRPNTDSTASSRTNTGSTTSSRPNTDSTASSRTNTGSTTSSRTNTGSTTSSRTNTESTASSRTNTGSTTSSRTNTESTASSRTNTGSTTSSRTNTGSTTSSRTNTESTASSRTNTGSMTSSRPNTGSTTSSRTNTDSTTSSRTNIEQRNTTDVLYERQRQRYRNFNPHYFKSVPGRDFLADQEMKRTQEFKAKENGDSNDKKKQKNDDAGGMMGKDNISDANITNSFVDTVEEVKTSSSKCPSLNVHARPFVPQAVKGASLQSMTSLGKVRQKRGSQAIKNKKEAAGSAKDAINPQTKEAGVKEAGVKEAGVKEQYLRDKTSSEVVSSSISKRYQERSKSYHNEKMSKGAKVGESNTSGQVIGKASAPHSKDAKSKPKRANRVDAGKAAALHSFTEKKPTDAINIENLREYLIENLVKGSYECAICYGVVNQETAVWSCGKCHHLFHFYCIKRWANTLMNQGEDREKWRCPTCQEAYATVPNQYRCYCGKIRDPVWNNHDTPHSCGEVCGRKRADNCSHKCNELCHPGPCPPCSAYTFKHCNCGRSCQNVRCSQQVNVRCSLTCEKKLNCGKHTCLTVCHAGSCQPCDEVIQQVCHCGTSQRQITCGSEGPYSEVYSCGKDCDRLLSCGKHNCTQPCHSGSCLPCKTSPEVVLNCNCGKVPLAALKDCEPRTSCTDSIPSCENICGKELNCGSQFKEASSASTFKRHLCQLMCHEGACLCRLTSKITCQCGNKKSTMPCEEAMKYSAGNPYKCEKKCSKKRECGRHKCGQLCCTLANHPCMQICGKRLSCGTHKCTELCHLGKCPMCYNVSFDELHCHCGVTIMYPPIPCGTRPPECPEMCNRLHACEHPVLHRCHAEESCPPCATLTTKLCMGEHELRNNVPCWIKELSCGRTCARPLPCGDHKCPKTCHKGECGEQVCHQPCPREREACKHRCGAECHKGWECPSTDCHQRVTLQCACGNRKQEVLCYMKNKRLHTSTLASRLKELGSGLTISELTSSLAKNQLECDEECAQLERNQRIASALDICNPNLLASLAGMQYSDFLKDMARKDPVFISDVETSLSQLVLSSQQSKQLTRSHPFKPMKKKQRTAVHELAEHYSCTTLSYDEEPLRNVVATAHRGKSKLPTQSLTSFVKCEKQPPPPVPIPANANFQELQNKSKKDLQSTDIKSEDNEITDYFDMT